MVNGGYVFYNRALFWILILITFFAIFVSYVSITGNTVSSSQNGLLKVYAQHRFSISNTANVYSFPLFTGTSVEVYDLSGKFITRATITYNPDSPSYFVAIRGLSPGKSYVLKVSVPGFNTATTRITLAASGVTKSFVTLTPRTPVLYTLSFETARQAYDTQCRVYPDGGNNGWYDTFVLLKKDGLELKPTQRYQNIQQYVNLAPGQYFAEKYFKELGSYVPYPIVTSTVSATVTILASDRTKIATLTTEDENGNGCTLTP